MDSINGGRFKEGCDGEGVGREFWVLKGGLLSVSETLRLQGEFLCLIHAR
jgi:hypothetical protein